MPRLVRRKPLSERLMAMLNPIDFLLWLSEELETRDWDSNLAGTQLGLALNFVFLLARANSGAAAPSDDIFRDDSGAGWLSFFIHPLVWILAIFSCANAFYTVTRSRKYRLFEANVEEKPSTPSARRVKIQSSPGSASPLRYIVDMVAPETASSRAHPDKATDVWELSVWDPLPVSTRLVCLFSPGHVLAYLISLPLAPLDPRPSVTVFNALLVQVVLSAQLLLFSSLYKQQAKDQSIVQKEVLHEYDTKFVRPRIHPTVRDVGTQLSDDHEGLHEFVQAGTPTTLIRHSFHTRQNPHLDELSLQGYGNTMSPNMFTPPNATRRTDSLGSVSTSRPSTSRKSMPAAYTSATTSTTNIPSSYTHENTSFGGSLGVYTHNQSPLKKATSLNDMNAGEQPSPRNSREMASYEQRNYRRQSSPVKSVNDRASSRPNPFAPAPKPQPRSQYERFPSRRQF